MDTVRVKGSDACVDVFVDDASDFPRLLLQLNCKILENRNTLQGKNLKIQLHGAPLTAAQKQKIEQCVEDATKKRCRVKPVSIEDFLGQDEDVCIFRYGAVRSGEHITSRGHIVVFGNVNPGAFLTAEKSIVVLGSMRGVAHCGSSGNCEVVLAALDLRPGQIRIGSVYTRPPVGRKRPDKAEFAFLADGKIMIEAI